MPSLRNSIAVDPLTWLEVRFTDNGLREGDCYPSDQSSEPLPLDAMGLPYAISDYYEEESVDDG